MSEHLSNTDGSKKISPSDLDFIKKCLMKLRTIATYDKDEDLVNEINWFIWKTYDVKSQRIPRS